MLRTGHGLPMACPAASQRLLGGAACTNMHAFLLKSGIDLPEQICITLQSFPGNEPQALWQKVHACWGFVKPMRWDEMLSCCKAHLMASCEMLEPCALAYSAACLHAAFTSSGAGCHSGGPWSHQTLSKGRIPNVPAQCCILIWLQAMLWEFVTQVHAQSARARQQRDGGGRCQTLKPQSQKSSGRRS